MQVKEFLDANRCDVGCRFEMKDGHVLYGWEIGVSGDSFTVRICADGKEAPAYTFLAFEEVGDVSILDPDNWVRATGVPL